MRIEEENINGILAVRVMDNRIDASSAASFKGRMADIVARGDRLLILNLAAVEFIDSTGLGAIVSALKAVGQGGELVITNPQETVMSLLRLTRMNRVFRIYASEQEALGALADR
jgi:anti-sigma B factor antagonist